MSITRLRIHPAIGIARVGNSEDYYLGPETMAGMNTGKTVTGGLPIKPGTNDTTIMSTDLRDQQGRLKRQAARFKIYQYQFDDEKDAGRYPAGQGNEVQIGSKVGFKTVSDIIWTVHLANKKADSWYSRNGIVAYEGGKLPERRNLDFADGDEIERLKKLVIDAGPRALRASRGDTIQFDNKTQPSYGDQDVADITAAPDYPVTFPASNNSDVDPYSHAIKSLGAISCENNGRLLVLGGSGLACGFDKNGNFDPNAELKHSVNNDNWLDDTADGPVTAFLLFNDGSMQAVEGSAWVISTDPAYAPQTTNVVTLWDDIYSTWLEHLQLRPEIYAGGKFNLDYQPHYGTEILPVFTAASLQKWNVSLPEAAVLAHDKLLKAKPIDDGIRVMNFLRNPNEQATQQNDKLMMPLSLGDVNKSFLSVTKSQYFFLSQWSDEKSTEQQTQPLGPGETLDKSVLFNCLGGRFSPGIEMSFPCRDINLYRQDWAQPASGGPFRINMQPLDYSKARKDTPFLGTGYTPLRAEQVQPGDICKFMALPWHTDYNSCATHTPEPNPGGRLSESNIEEATDLNPQDINTLIYASWPAQRPVAVYTYADVVANGGNLSTEEFAVTARFSIRGKGTEAEQEDEHGFNRPAMNVGRYQERKEFLRNWQNVGFVIQSPAIEGAQEVSVSYYLEVESKFDKDESNLVEHWRNTVIDKLYPPK